MAAFLAQAHPFRQAARLLGWMTGTTVDHRRLWGMGPDHGERIRRGWEGKRAALFDDGVLPAGGGGRPRIASTEPADRFGQTFYVLAEGATDLSRAAEVFYVGDGAGSVGSLPHEWIRPTAVQLDHFHGKLRIKELARDPDRAARCWGYVASHNLEALGRSLRHCIRARQVAPHAGEELLGYFRRGAAALDTFRGLREAGHSAQMAPRGSGHGDDRARGGSRDGPAVQEAGDAIAT